MKTLSSPLPIPTDHNPFDFYSYRGKQGLERQESVQPKTWSGTLEFKSKFAKNHLKSYQVAEVAQVVQKQWKTVCRETSLGEFLSLWILHIVMIWFEKKIKAFRP